uniref:Proteasome assembly chaperone 3 n=1 Tax=Rhodosorus marinus TaxID=101924 RepID=A0A7S3EJE8_9RHOD|mmetsp:Transcript_410/g.773  ORF Transcript_410/g.773 Transcript_410/m.773 type:complete len:132 (+) Transcript_410:193-588(+)|eukprot:CAMPEP_0113963442 /NCGR_PEP_ID=MMETSP0011_2-20120614/6514_1 /TAXON_ID=101924 /ORGANISM="Rhodosorus marinus" /LENGTH=131 /DNA_ID=CAMNT_0000975489 /DNA_START=86 /DNA_END=481 /DNA_ORIENTATION=+ /assembly_acc=CAM_ASM_000156
MKFAEADASHPVHSVKQLEADIAGVKTLFFAEKFSDRILILISQTGKIGTIIQAAREITMDGNPSFTVQTLLGAPSEDLSLDLCARRIIESVAMTSTTSLPVLLCVSLQGTSVPQEHVKRLVEIVEENKVW